ncbi:MAG: methyltransferase [Pseudomonadota bacterium]
MIGTRLPLALKSGVELPAQGGLAVLHPPTDADISALPTDRCIVVTPNVVTHDAFKARGYSASTECPDMAAAVIVCLPRARAEARMLVSQAMKVTDGLVIIDGQKTDGVEAMLKAVRAEASVDGSIAKAHGKIFWLPSSDAFTDWEAGPALTDGGFWTAPGVFSADGIDPASALLTAALPDELGPVVADLGAGWGFLSAHILAREAIERLHIVEAHHLALQCAEHNVTDPRAVFHWADATRWSATEGIDDVVLNPPFHVGRAAQPDLGQGFIRNAAAILKPRGRLWMVANRHLPYEDLLASLFAKSVEIGGDARFKLLYAERPKRRS